MLPGQGRRVGVIEEESVVDLTTGDCRLTSVYAAFQTAFAKQISFTRFLKEAATAPGNTRYSYSDLLEGTPGEDSAYLLPPVDHPDPHCLLVTGTGLTHTGSMQPRDQMPAHADDASQTESAKVFARGLAGGKTPSGIRGGSPEGF